MPDCPRCLRWTEAGVHCRHCGEPLRPPASVDDDVETPAVAYRAPFVRAGEPGAIEVRIDGPGLPPGVVHLALGGVARQPGLALRKWGAAPVLFPFVADHAGAATIERLVVRAGSLQFALSADARPFRVLQTGENPPANAIHIEGNVYQVDGEIQAGIRDAWIPLAVARKANAGAADGVLLPAARARPAGDGLVLEATHQRTTHRIAVLPHDEVPFGTRDARPDGRANLLVLAEAGAGEDRPAANGVLRAGPDGFLLERDGAAPRTLAEAGPIELVPDVPATARPVPAAAPDALLLDDIAETASRHAGIARPGAWDGLVLTVPCRTGGPTCYAVLVRRLGLGSEADVALPLPGVAPHHADLYRYGDQVLVSPSGGGAVVSVDDTPVAPGEFAPLAPGSLLRLGPAALAVGAFEPAGPPAPSRPVPAPRPRPRPARFRAGLVAACALVACVLVAVLAKLLSADAPATTPAVQVPGRGADRELAGRARADAEAAWSRIRTIAREPGLEPLFAEADAARDRARGATGPDAGAWDEVCRLSREIEALDAQRTEARERSGEASAARVRADGAGAAERGGAAWDQAEAASVRATAAWEAGRFEDAAEGWKRATTAYRDAEERARPLPAAVGDPGRDVEALAVRADGRYLATAQADRVTVWRLDNRTRCAAFGAGTAAVTAVAFGPGDLLAFGDAAGAVRVVSIGSGGGVSAERHHPGKIESLAYAADGRLAVGCKADAGGAAWLWHVDGHAEKLETVAGWGLAGFLGQDVVVAGRDGLLRWVRGTAPRPEPLADGPVLGLSVDPLGLYAVVWTGHDAFLLAGPRKVRLTDYADAVAWSPDGRLVATAHPGGRIRVWVARPALRESPLHTLKAGGEVLALAFHGDGMVVGLRAAAGAAAPPVRFLPLW